MRVLAWAWWLLVGGRGPVRADWACGTSPTTGSASSRSSGRRKGSVPEGRIIALDGEAGYQADLLRGGLHFGLWRWQYRIHKVALVTVPQGKIGYVYARDGEPLPPSQTLGRVVDCNNFQDARAFLLGEPVGADGEPRARPARPAAGDPPRGRLRDQPRPVRRDHRGRGLPPGAPGPARAGDAGQLAERADARSTASARS